MKLVVERGYSQAEAGRVLGVDSKNISHWILVVANNLLNREFNVTRPNEKWVSDITYLWTLEGWLYVAAVLDLFSRRVVGWAMSDSMKTDLVENAFEMARRRRQPTAGFLHHSDRGVQYASERYQMLLKKSLSSLIS